MSILIAHESLGQEELNQVDILTRPSHKIFSIYIHIYFSQSLKSSDMYTIHRVPVYNCIKISLQGDLIYLTLSQHFSENLCHT